MAREKLLSLKIIYRCQNRCVFCGEDDTRDDRAPLPPASRLLAELDRAAARGSRHVSFVGGEPTLHPALPTLLRRARELGFETRHISTNGRLLARPGVAGALVEAGLSHVDVSVHADGEELGDRLMGAAGGWIEQQAGLRRLIAASRGGRPLVTVDTVLLRSNQGRLRGLHSHLRAEGVRHHSLYLCRPSGAAAGTPHELPRLAELRDQLRELFALDPAERGSLQTFSVPLCLLPEGQLHRALEARGRFEPEHRHTSGRAARRRSGWSERLARLRERLRERDSQAPAACRRCAARDICPRPEGPYPAQDGGRWMRPLAHSGGELADSERGRM